MKLCFMRNGHAFILCYNAFCCYQNSYFFDKPISSKNKDKKNFYKYSSYMYL